MSLPWKIKEIKQELAKPCEPMVGPLREARKIIEIHELIHDEEHRHDPWVYPKFRSMVKKAAS